MRSTECGVRSVECGVRSAECGIDKEECNLYGVGENGKYKNMESGKKNRNE